MIKRPLTTAQKQSRRRAALDEIARSSGWVSWSEYATAVKRGIVKIEARETKSDPRKDAQP